MPRTKLHETAELGQSLWLDFINRELIESGSLQQLIDDGLRGMTSNPAIFNQVISGGNDYDNTIRKLKGEGKSAFEIYDALSVKDIQDAADKFLPVFKETDRLDGYVSLEIDPRMANQTEESIAEGKRLFALVNRPNVMIKVPATEEGFPVIEALLADGINVNVTLIFSLEQYEKTAKAYINGLQQLAISNKDLSKVRSVASVFVSRIDAVIDHMLDEQIAKSKEESEIKALKILKGKAALANSQRIFTRAGKMFSSEMFNALKRKGAHEQRVLWGSTSTKNPEYPDTMYVDQLIGSPTVNTVPEKTLRAFMDHGTAAVTLGRDADIATSLLNDLKVREIDIADVCQRLLDGGVIAFVKSFDELLASVEEKANQLAAH